MDAYFELFRDRNFDIHLADQKNNFIDAHYHSNLEIVYVMDGEIEITVGEYTRLLKAGEVSVANSYDIHRYMTPAYSVIKLLIIPIELIGSFLRLSEGKTFASPFLSKPQFTRPILSAMKSLESTGIRGKSLTVKGYLYVILGLLSDGLGLVPCDRHSGALGPIREMLLYLELNFKQPIYLSELAKKFGYNKDYLSRMFNTSMGCGFKYYLNLLRARNAANLILNSDLPMYEVAYQSGFTSQRTFHRFFKELYDTTPIEYKNRYTHAKESETAI